MSNAEEPATELVIVAEVVDVTGSVDERLLDDIEASLLVMNQFVSISVKGQLITLEQCIPSHCRSGPGLFYGQLFAFGHYQHLYMRGMHREEKGSIKRAV